MLMACVNVLLQERMESFIAVPPPTDYDIPPELEELLSDTLSKRERSAVADALSVCMLFFSVLFWSRG